MGELRFGITFSEQLLDKLVIEKRIPHDSQSTKNETMLEACAWCYGRITLRLQGEIH